MKAAVSSMILIAAAMVLLAADGLQRTTAQPAAGIKATAQGLSVDKPNEAHYIHGGMQVSILVTSSNGNIVSFDSEASRIKSYEDNVGTNLLRRQKEHVPAITWHNGPHAFATKGEEFFSMSGRRVSHDKERLP